MLTSVVLALVLLTAPAPWESCCSASRRRCSRSAAALGVQRTPRAYALQDAVRPRLAAPAQLEDPQPRGSRRQSAWSFALVGLVGYSSGATLVGAIATGFALAAALLNAVFGSAWAARCTC